MVQSMVSVVVIFLMVWVSIPHMGTYDPLGMLVIACVPVVPEGVGFSWSYHLGSSQPSLGASGFPTGLGV